MEPRTPERGSLPLSPALLPAAPDSWLLSSPCNRGWELAVWPPACFCHRLSRESLAHETSSAATILGCALPQPAKRAVRVMFSLSLLGSFGVACRVIRAFLPPQNLPPCHRHSVL